MAALAVLSAATGCAPWVGDTAAGDLTNLRVMVPNAPGSGYDITARTVAKALEDGDIVRGVEVFNLPGAGGAVGLRRLVYEKGNGRLLMLMGLGLVGAQHTVGPGPTLAQTTPIARLVEEPEVVVVTKDSPYASLADLIAAWRAAPEAVPVGGGSSPGGPDHLAPMLLAHAIGIDARAVEYVRYDGGGELLAAILGKQVAFGVSSIGEYADQIRSGQLRVLAVTSDVRVPGLPAPTLREAGVDLVFSNWRGIVAPPEIPADDLAALGEALARLHASPGWRRVLARNGWTDAYLIGEEFAGFIRAEDERLTTVLRDLRLSD